MLFIIKWTILLITAWLASTISGIVGFGGSLIILPVFAHVIDVKQAIPVLTIAWMMGNASRAALGWRDIQWKPALYFCAGAIPAAIVGSMVFVELPAGMIMKTIGVFLLFIVLTRRLKWKYSIPEQWFIPFGVLVGFLSSVVGSAGPIGAVAFLSLNLAPAAYVASEAVTAVAMHLTKTVVYKKYALIGSVEACMGIVLGLAMVVGSWTARKLIKKISYDKFFWIVDIVLIVAALSLFA